MKGLWIAPVVGAILMSSGNLGAADTKRVAWGDTVQFWDSYALVVATIEDSERRELQVQECVPPRYAKGVRFDFSGLSIKGILRTTLDQPAFVPKGPTIVLKGLEKGDRLLCIVRDVKGKIEVEHALGLKNHLLVLSASKYDSFAMLPDSRAVEKDGEAVVAAALRLCDALATADPSAKVRKLEVILKAGPSDRVKEVIRHSLLTAVAEWDEALAKAKKLSADSAP